jgi:hypothetical protein
VAEFATANVLERESQQPEHPHRNSVLSAYPSRQLWLAAILALRLCKLPSRWHAYYLISGRQRLSRSARALMTLMAVQYLPWILRRHTEHRATGWYVRAECILPTTAAAACLMDAMVIECKTGTCCVLFRIKTLDRIALSVEAFICEIREVFLAAAPANPGRLVSTRHLRRCRKQSIALSCRNQATG